MSIGTSSDWDTEELQIRARTRQVEEQIRAAWASAIYAGDAVIYDGQDQNDSQLALVDQTWQDVDAETVEQAIDYLLPPAMRYFLPAFMIHSLHKLETLLRSEGDFNRGLAAAARFLPETEYQRARREDPIWTRAELAARFRKRFTGMAEDQYQAIGAYLGHVLYLVDRYGKERTRFQHRAIALRFWPDPDVRAAFLEFGATFAPLAYLRHHGKPVTGLALEIRSQDAIQYSPEPVLRFFRDTFTNTSIQPYPLDVDPATEPGGVPYIVSLEIPPPELPEHTSRSVWVFVDDLSPYFFFEGHPEAVGIACLRTAEVLYQRMPDLQELSLYRPNRMSTTLRRGEPMEERIASLMVGKPE